MKRPRAMAYGIIQASSFNQKVPYPIFNMGSGTDCPSKALGLCRIGKACYACKAERLYPQVLPFRRRQEIAWKTATIQDFVNAFSLFASRTKSKFIRINESGDFYSEFCVRKLYAIAGKLPGIRFFMYTARRDLFEKNPALLGQAPKNVILTGSGFMLHNEFGPHYPDSKTVCKGHCGECSLCKVRGHKTIYNPMH